MIDRTKFGQVRDEQAKNVAALRRFRDLAVLRYTRRGDDLPRGFATPSNRCSTPSSLYVGVQSQLFQSYVNLYKAMGGGWVDDAEKLSADQSANQRN